MARSKNVYSRDIIAETLFDAVDDLSEGGAEELAQTIIKNLAKQELHIVKAASRNGS